MKYKNVLEIINLFGSAKGFLGGHMQYLQKEGYNMHLICSPDETLESYSHQIGINSKGIFLDRHLNILADISAFFKICSYIRKNRIDTVITHQAKASLLGLCAAWMMRVPNRIYMAHGVLGDTLSGWKLKVFVLVTKIISRHTHKIICVSPSVMKRRVELGIDNPSKQYILNKGTCGCMDTINKFNPDLYSPDCRNNLRSQYNIDQDCFLVGFCGRLVKDKGIVELLDGFRLFTEKYPNDDIKLMIIGKKEVFDSIPQETQYIINNQPNIVFTGYVDSVRMPEYFLMMDVLTLPSKREGFPTVVLEANAMSVPCIVSRSTGCIDSILENETGLYTDISCESIASNLDRLYEKNFRQQLKNNCRNFVVDNFEQTKLWPILEEIIQK